VDFIGSNRPAIRGLLDSSCVLEYSQNADAGENRQDMKAGKNYEKSYQTLKSRYGSEELLRQAALRRSHLNYQPIRFGPLNGQKNYLRTLLPQAHAAYYLGSFHACISLCGSMLEALLQMCLREELKQEGVITFGFYFQGSRVEKVTRAEELEKMSFNDMINFCKQKKILSEQLFRDLCFIKDIRNKTLHERIPRFREVEGSYVLVLKKGNFVSRISLEPGEVGELNADGYQITAYYCLSRMRRIFARLLSAPETHPPPGAGTQEPGGRLFPDDKV
jgi:hypothetical protein